MNEPLKQDGPIVVYGATGYTGKLIAAELATSGLDFQLAGRNRQKLEDLGPPGHRRSPARGLGGRREGPA
jgi:short subunit dehydrogenase-like uncharacterized protein